MLSIIRLDTVTLSGTDLKSMSSQILLLGRESEWKTNLVLRKGVTLYPQ